MRAACVDVVARAITDKISLALLPATATPLLAGELSDTSRKIRERELVLGVEADPKYHRKSEVAICSVFLVAAPNMLVWISELIDGGSGGKGYGQTTLPPSVRSAAAWPSAIVREFHYRYCVAPISDQFFPNLKGYAHSKDDCIVARHLLNSACSAPCLCSTTCSAAWCRSSSFWVVIIELVLVIQHRAVPYPNTLQALARPDLRETALRYSPAAGLRALLHGLVVAHFRVGRRV